jgi:DNA-binding CsgD family transcriptional regulator
MRIERPLTAHQAEIVRLCCSGLSTAQVAARLGMTTGTVRSKRHIVYQKLRVSTLEDACRVLQESGEVGT